MSNQPTVNFEEILSRLDNVQRRWGYYSARCPAHEDRRNSLSLKEGKYIQCHAGCTYEEIMEALSEGSEASGFHRNAASKEPDTGSVALPSESGPRPADPNDFPMVYDYVDENGVLEFKVCRTWDKRFFQCHPDYDSPTGFYWGLGGARRVLYRLPRLRGAVRAAQTVYVVEGEKDVHAVEKAGGVATCCPMGAGKWREEFNSEFDGAYVVVVPDMDKAGKEHADDVVNHLLMWAEDVRLRAPVSGKDVHDHLKAGHTLEDLVEIEIAV